MTASISPSSRPSLLSRILRFLLLLSVFVGGVILGVAGYTFLFTTRDWFTRTVSENETRLTHLEARQNQLETQTYERLNDLQARVGDLEVQSDNFKLQLDEESARLDLLPTLEGYLASNREALPTLQRQITDLQTGVKSQEQTLSQLEAKLTALGQVATTQAQLEATLTTLQTQMQLTRAATALARSRLALSENNFGRAALELDQAYQLLLALKNTAPAEKASLIDVLLAQLDLTRQAIPSRPVVAADQLDAALSALNLGFEPTPTPLT
ncbi:hypothetical protein ATHL_02567, partial [Anaerolinea thermolimosa]